MYRICLLLFLVMFHIAKAQEREGIKWAEDGKSFYFIKNGQLNKVDLDSGNEKVILSGNKLKPASTSDPLNIEDYWVHENGNLILIFTNSARVWRYNTRGDYWIYDQINNKLKKIGTRRPAQSLMFAKISPDGKNVAYVSVKNIYIEDIQTGMEKALTSSGKDKMINGTFDWVYEEEFFARDGFRWSDDSKHIAYWQVDANGTRDYFMVNNTDSIYPSIIPVEYPKVGQPISRVRIGVISILNNGNKWMDIPGDPGKNYLVRMEWQPGKNNLIVQQLDRKQQKSILYLCDAVTGATKVIQSETDNAWIDILPSWDGDYANGGWDWLEKGNRFLWASEKDGWRHLYSVGINGDEILLTPGKFDIMDIVRVDEKNNTVFFMASPDNATQKYLYKVALKGNSIAERSTPLNQTGTHEYLISPNGTYAYHTFSNHYTPYVSEWLKLPSHKSTSGIESVNDALSRTNSGQSGVEFFKVKTLDGVEMDGWVKKPKNFDTNKKYPIVFFVYTEPWGQEVKDIYGIGNNNLYVGNMSEDGYIYVCIDNRGTPVPKGREWRKSIYRKIGRLNISDQANAAKEILKWNYVDSSRVAVWGWSGGGSATLNLMFQYPEIYKTGISIAAVANQLTYDNVYHERYMGPPNETRDDYIKGSPLSYAKNLKGNLLYIHGTADDNVHYQNAEMLINELIKYNKQFQFMSYPNRTHAIREGEGTSAHLRTLYTDYLRSHCPPGAK
ncbi:MAG: DPP IV N-terminal domain-containing protein [Chitinophagaceae bacterium]